ncbi:PAS domain S-box protein [Rhizobium sp. P38BS-XIX]|uniref:PAS domain S-box protein n=1 Tax=Rhizobium sp. P38BS-XIX TaxID=2726740 RepID=UPI001456E012|nr:PAS domain S-box protein [Rhizobium sp. P38BS-XIX]NLS01288.1 PAS domain S-box protein [Rhizobium sp. P38BS-XIX]
MGDFDKKYGFDASAHPRAPNSAPSGRGGINDQRPRDWLAAIIDGSDDAIVSKDVKGIIQSWNYAATRLFGYSAEEVVGKSITIIIPEDRLEEEPAILAQIQSGNRVEHFETKRRRKDGSLVDISLTISPIRNAEGVVIGASKIARDITERRLAQEQQQLLMVEMRHRIKNLFALAGAIVSISARSSAPEEVVAQIQARLSSLSKAHELTMSALRDEPESEERVDLLSLIRIILEPYADDGRIDVQGDNPQIGGASITHVALMLHELATNAAKHGSLSIADGRLSIHVRDTAEDVHIDWQEVGGPGPSPDASADFGGRLEKGVTGMLAATLERDWKAAGLAVSIVLPKAKLGN